MLSKLIKHEFRATSRIMWPVFLGMLALTALMRFSQLLLNGGHIPWLLQLIGVLLVIGFVMGLFALAFAPLVLSACRWRDHVLKDEGYLTLTLPVSLHQLLISKLIVSAVWYAAAFIVGLLSLLIAASGWSTFQYVPDFFNDVFTAFFGMEASLRSHALLIVFELFCNFVFAVSAAELVVYAAYSIGYSFNKRKTLWTTILVLVFFEVAQFTAIAMIGAFFNANPTRWMYLDVYSAPAIVELLLLWGMFGELLFAAASVILDVLRTFYLIVLSLLGPIAFAISVFDGFQSTLTQWLTKYVSIYLWLPISDLFSAIIARLQTLSMRHDADLMAEGYNWYVDWSNSLNLIFMLVAVCGYLCIPSIASWVVQANGFAAYNKTVSKMTSLVSAGAGWTAGKAWAGAKGAGSAALSGGKAVGRGIMNGARLIFRK